MCLFAALLRIQGTNMETLELHVRVSWHPGRTKNNVRLRF